jgi:hypothetical protein
VLTILKRYRNKGKAAIRSELIKVGYTTCFFIIALLKDFFAHFLAEVVLLLKADDECVIIPFEFRIILFMRQRATNEPKMKSTSITFPIFFKLPDDANGDYAPRLILTSPKNAVDS